MSITRKCHDHTLQTNPRHHEEEANTLHQEDNKGKANKTFHSETLLSNTFEVIQCSARHQTVQQYHVTGKQLKMFSRGNSSSKPDRTGRDGKVAKQSKMLNYSAYSRFGNNVKVI